MADIKPVFSPEEIAAMTLQELKDNLRWTNNLINDTNAIVSTRVLVNMLQARTDIEAEYKRKLRAAGMVQS
jgi:hypothetical protein